MAKVESLSTSAIPRGKPRPRLLRLSREDIVIFVGFFGVYLALALRLRGLDIFIGDAVSRTANAFWVLFSRDPHISAIGFIWNPLPSLIQLPLVAVLRLLRADVILAGNLMSAACGGATLLALNIAMRRANLPPRLRWPLLVLFGLNPMIMLYSANGMSELPFMLWIVLVVIGFIQWGHTDSHFAFSLMAFASAFALWTRYEALGLTAAIVFCIVPIHWPLAKYLGIQTVSERIEANVIAYLSVVTYFFGLWAYFNWLIMGDPLFFLVNIYGNISQTTQFRLGEATLLSSAVGSISGSLWYGLKQSLWLFPAFGAIVLLALFVSIRRRHVVLFCVLLISFAIPVFEVAMVYGGNSFGWLRFFSYGILFSYLLLAEVWRAAPELFSGRFRGIVWAAIFILLLLSNVASWFTMDNEEMGREEWTVTRKLVDPSQPSLGYSLADTRKVANYIAQFPPEEKVLLETFMGFGIPLLSPDPTRFVVTSDRDFEVLLRQPYGTVTYILVPKPEGLGANDRINREYPSLWESGTPWTELVREFDDTELHWKLYRVLSPSQIAPAAGS